MRAVPAVPRIFLLEAFIYNFLRYYRSSVPKLQVSFFLNNQLGSLIIQILFCSRALRASGNLFAHTFGPGKFHAVFF